MTLASWRNFLKYVKLFYLRSEAETGGDSALEGCIGPLLKPLTPPTEPNLTDSSRSTYSIPTTYPHLKPDTELVGEQSVQKSLLNPKRFEIPPEARKDQEYPVAGENRSHWML